jgi:hypothetical protein
MLATYFYNFTNALWHRTIFSFFVILSTVIFIIDKTGFYHIPDPLTLFIHKFINYYIIAILIMRFNPLVNKDVSSKTLSDYDRKISFSSGVLLLTTNFFNANF